MEADPSVYSAGMLIYLLLNGITAYPDFFAKCDKIAYSLRNGIYTFFKRLHCFFIGKSVHKPQAIETFPVRKNYMPNGLVHDNAVIGRRSRVIIALGKLVYAVAKRAERPAAQ